jgi:hypothetical protein
MDRKCGTHKNQKLLRNYSQKPEATRLIGGHKIVVKYTLSKKIKECGLDSSGSE